MKVILTGFWFVRKHARVVLSRVSEPSCRSHAHLHVVKPCHASRNFGVAEVIAGSLEVRGCRSLPSGGHLTTGTAPISPRRVFHLLIINSSAISLLPAHNQRHGDPLDEHELGFPRSATYFLRTAQQRARPASE